MPDRKEKKPDGTQVGQSPGYIPRPPSDAEVARISEQQGMITDEWAPAPAPSEPPAATPTEGTPAEEETQRQPG